MKLWLKKRCYDEKEETYDYIKFFFALHSSGLVSYYSSEIASIEDDDEQMVTANDALSHSIPYRSIGIIPLDCIQSIQQIPNSYVQKGFRFEIHLFDNTVYHMKTKHLDQGQLFVEEILNLCETLDIYFQKSSEALLSVVFTEGITESRKEFLCSNILEKIWSNDSSLPINHQQVPATRRRRYFSYISTVKQNSGKEEIVTSSAPTISSPEHPSMRRGVKWYFKDDNDDIQGPHSSAEMVSWYEGDYLAHDLFVTYEYEQCHGFAADQIRVFVRLDELFSLHEDPDFFAPPRISASASADPLCVCDTWHYKDDDGIEQGPFSSRQMKNWLLAELLDGDLLIRPSHLILLQGNRDVENCPVNYIRLDELWAEQQSFIADAFNQPFALSKVTQADHPTTTTTTTTAAAVQKKKPLKIETDAPARKMSCLVVPLSTSRRKKVVDLTCSSLILQHSPSNLSRRPKLGFFESDGLSSTANRSANNSLPELPDEDENGKSTLQEDYIFSILDTTKSLCSANQFHHAILAEIDEPGIALLIDNMYLIELKVNELLYATNIEFLIVEAGEIQVGDEAVFGSDALVEPPRQAAIRCKAASQLWIMECEKFRTIIKHLSRRRQARYYRLLKGIPILFDHLTRKQLVGLADVCDTRVYEDGDAVLQVQEAMYIVKEGVVAMYDGDEFKGELWQSDTFGEWILLQVENTNTMRLVAKGRVTMLLLRSNEVLELVGPFRDLILDKWRKENACNLHNPASRKDSPGSLEDDNSSDFDNSVATSQPSQLNLNLHSSPLHSRHGSFDLSHLPTVDLPLGGSSHRGHSRSFDSASGKLHIRAKRLSPSKKSNTHHQRRYTHCATDVAGLLDCTDGFSAGSRTSSQRKYLTPPPPGRRRKSRLHSRSASRASSVANVASTRGSSLNRRSVSPSFSGTRPRTCSASSFNSKYSVGSYGYYESDEDELYEELDLAWDTSIVPELNMLQLNDLIPTRVLGKGSFSQVHLVHLRQDSSTEFALKCCNKQLITLNSWTKLLNNERSALLEVCRLNCPFVVKLFNTFQDAKNIYLLTDYIKNGDLHKLLCNHPSRKIDFESVRFYAACVLVALQAIHSLEIIYRDLKPENLMLTERGYIKIVDFGLAKKTLRTFTTCGTPEYMAPECILSRGVDSGVDWWALGVVVYELLNGVTPFFARDPASIYENILAHKQPSDLVFIHQDFAGFNEASSLCRTLLNPNRVKRLRSISKLWQHRFFLGLDFAALKRLQLVAPQIAASNADYPDAAPRSEEEQYEPAAQYAATHSYFPINTGADDGQNQSQSFDF